MGKKIAQKIGKENSFYSYGSNVYLGKYENYDVIIRYDFASLIFNINFNVKGKNNIDALNKILSKIDKFAVARYREPNLTITESCDSIKDMPSLANRVLEVVTQYLKKNNYHNLCKKCKKDKDTFLVNIDENVLYCCEECYKKSVKDYEKELQEKKNIKENVIAGFFGAILGSIPGVVLWFALAYLMVNPTVIALIIMLGSAYGYKWAAKSMKLPGLLISLLVGFFNVILANEFSNAYILYNEYINQYHINIFDAYKALPYYLNNSQSFKGIYQQNLLLSAMFGFFGGLSSFGIYRRFIASNKIKKLEVK